jgi:hypothetical protein
MLTIQVPTYPRMCMRTAIGSSGAQPAAVRGALTGRFFDVYLDDLQRLQRRCRQEVDNLATEIAGELFRRHIGERQNADIADGEDEQEVVTMQHGDALPRRNQVNVIAASRQEDAVVKGSSSPASGCLDIAIVDDIVVRRHVAFQDHADMEVVPMQRFPPAFMHDEVGAAELQVLLRHDHGVALQVTVSFAPDRMFRAFGGVPSA